MMKKGKQTQRMKGKLKSNDINSWRTCAIQLHKCVSHSSNAIVLKCDPDCPHEARSSINSNSNINYTLLLITE